MIDDRKIEQAQAKAKCMYSNYVGNKRKILGWIANNLNAEGVLEYKHFVDLFGGSGICSYFFSLLGLSGCINELMFSSHSMHRSMFSHVQEIGEFDCDLPFGVNSDLTYKEVPVEEAGLSSNPDKAVKAKKKSGKNTRDLFSNFDDCCDSAEELRKELIDNVVPSSGLVSVDASFTSDNGVFNNLWKVIKPYVGRNISAREGIEICCCLTNSIMYGIDEYDWMKSNVLCLCGDSLEFLKQKKYQVKVNPKDAFVYIDPPYGDDNNNSKYYKIYDMLECIAFAAYVLRAKLMEKNSACNDVKKAVLSIGDISDISSNVEDLMHIKKYAMRFSGSAKFREDFEEMLSLLRYSDFPCCVFSFAGSASFTGCQGIVDILQRFFCNVAVYSMRYDYSYHKTSDTSHVSLGSNVIGQDTHGVAGIKETTDSEMLFICKR